MTSTEPTSAPPLSPGSELPIHLTRFVGRDRELDDLSRLVGNTRLLTLTGAGGSGKTRLAREAAMRASAAYERLAWVDLSALCDEGLLAQQIATALHIIERADASHLELLIGNLCTERTLLVLDNCEHLVDACATLVDALLRACPRLCIVATSREALGVESETAWLVPPLASAEAIQLFVERAQATLPSFTLTAANSAAVAEICRRLDGIPLAIELAAARVRVLSPEQIAKRLDDAFRLLSGGSRTALPRHRTLRATMEWSFALLGTREQVLLRRLALFACSFSLDAAEAICAGGPLETEDILDGVSALVDRSLVVMEPGDGVARYRLLETVRQYGVERLVEAQELETQEARFAEHFLRVVEDAAPNLVGGSNAPGLVARLVADQDNIRAAIAWAVADPSRAEIALRFAGVLFWFWYALGQFREARHLADRALSMDANADPLLRARALESSALTALAQGDYQLSRAHFSEAIRLLRAHGEASAAGTALAKFGAAQLLGGDVESAIVTLEEAVALTREMPENDMAGVFARFWRGWAAYTQNDLASAEAMMVRNVEIARTYNLPTTLAHSLATLGRIEMARGDVERGCALASESLELEVAINDAWGIALALDVIAIAAVRRGRHDDAARLLAGIEAHRERVALAVPGIAPAERVEMLAQLREALGPSFDAIYTAGRALPTTEVVSLALAEAARHTTEHRVMVAPERPTTSEARLRVHALGPLQVFVGDRAIDSTAWGSARPRELLVYLLMHPEGRTKEQAGLAFWPDASTAQLRNSFHVTLHRLRKALGGANWVTLSGDRYRVEPSLLEAFDAAEFEREVITARRALKRQEEGASGRLEQVVAQYRGDLLDGEPVGDWHIEHRERLQRLYIEALMDLGSSFVREERHSKAAETYRRVLARDELHEEALVALMRALADAGERSQALRVYRRFADRLREELDAEPDDETTRFFEKLQVSAV